MAYMRGEVYAYRSAKHMNIHLGGTPIQPTQNVSVPQEEFDALVLMRMAELAKEPAAWGAAVERAREEVGNFGSGALMELLGMPTPVDFLRQVLAGDARELPRCEKCGGLLLRREEG